MHALARICGLLGLVLLASGCQSPARAPAIGSAWRSDQAPTAIEQARIDENCGPLGRPTVRPQHKPRVGPTRMVTYDQFVLEHSSVDRIPIWVAEHVTPAEVSGDIPRRDAFKAEPSLPVGERDELSDYRGSGYDRGHMAPAGNQTVDPDRKKETFTLANMVPQNGPQNQQIWADLEATVRDWGKQGELYVITGPLFWEEEEDSATTADGQIDYYTIGTNMVAVPTHTYKIVARQRGADWETIAFVIKNDNSFERPWSFASYIKPVAYIEDRTGIDFFPNGGAAVEQSESAASPMWP
jgi:endonuclease G, mitochondrial